MNSLCIYLLNSAFWTKCEPVHNISTGDQIGPDIYPILESSFCPALISIKVIILYKPSNKYKIF